MRLGVAMPAALAALAGGILAWYSHAEALTPNAFGWLLVAALLVMVWCPRVGSWLLIGGWVFIGVQNEWGSRLPAGLSGEDISVEATVLTAQPLGNAMRLLLSIDKCQSAADRPARPSCSALSKVRISAYSDERFEPGEQWQMTLRLRPPSGFANPDSFNYEQWLWREGIHATGYLRQEPAPVRLSTAGPSLRQLALGFLAQQTLEERTKRWLAALTLGDSEQLTQDDWSLLNATGTTHLVVISGLHVGLVASFVLLLAKLAARFTTPTNWRMRTWPWWLAALACVSYATLAGMAPPAMRAMVMTLIGLWVLSGRHAPGPWQAWWLALALVLIADPLALWRPGMWLSFVAVAWLILIWQGRQRPKGVKGWCWALVRSQLLLAPLMAAAVLMAFGRVAPAAPLINLVAVPWVSSVMVPTALLGWLLSPVPLVGDSVWWLFEQALSVFHLLLTLAVQHWPLWEPDRSLTYPLAFALLLLSLCWGLPAVLPGLRLAATALALALPWWSLSSSIPPNTLRVSVYDVGQGQLVELRSEHYRLLYDTGPRFRSGFMPLETLWSPGQQFDQVIVSHADNDHAGGIGALLADHRVSQWVAPKGEALPVSSIDCQRGQRWQRDGVRYRILWPPAGENDFSANDRSCVLEVSIGEQRLLVTGDVGTEIERRFLSKVALPVNVLVAGHHGSGTSSGIQFVRHTAPEHVIFSAGRRNAFHHPVDSVVRRFRQQGSCLWSTAHDGALYFWLNAAQPIRIETMRPLPGQRNRC
ncbi:MULTISPECIES: DNA internalization-related competence protein ComEC/Rec2 [unclassified Halomonas]|uniref:DNA internalization-related competence protein ComEC/Rec2 n=1 Tax=unclassified Halomonas TaxID=2609666 RepID=UPI0007D9A4CD|nr:MULTISPECIES: DNA internalization-related competence protein ComEC/Rec2 [unclassified Halomonas]MBT2787532.1 DNA internalization-related competence protein ComEC/Rec2 [Halomonas sp. ISL-106]MBT2796106.1 DNA internalization-related competence protein ComEC/Rec2 [Halomonas sp. ISL-104]OAL57732.1 DNA internalization-related competence protein ComEC/Rec2 [Halomonas sp. ALS9]